MLISVVIKNNKTKIKSFISKIVQNLTILSRDHTFTLSL